MRVRLLISRATVREAQNRGDIIEVSDGEGVRLIERGQAEPVREYVPEKAVNEPSVERAFPKRGRKPRGA